MKKFKTIAELKLNYLYLITPKHYGALVATLGNRGGIDNARVKQFVRMIEAGKFDFDYNLITVDINLNIIDGHHRFIALMMMEKSFTIRVAKPKTLIEIANINWGMKTQYKAAEVFRAAKTLNSKSAVLVDTIHKSLCAELKLPESKITYSEMYGIAVKNIKCFGQGKNAPLIEQWMEDSLYCTILSSEFQKNVALFGQMKSTLRSVRDVQKITKVAMALHFDENVKFDLEAFVTALSYDGFVLPKYITATIKPKMISMYKKQLRNPRLVKA